jgi:hypothetical protein
MALTYVCRTMVIRAVDSTVAMINYYSDLKDLYYMREQVIDAYSIAIKAPRLPLPKAGVRLAASFMAVVNAFTSESVCNHYHHTIPYHHSKQHTTSVHGVEP